MFVILTFTRPNMLWFRAEHFWLDLNSWFSICTVTKRKQPQHNKIQCISMHARETTTWYWILFGSCIGHVFCLLFTSDSPQAQTIWITTRKKNAIAHCARNTNWSAWKSKPSNIFQLPWAGIKHELGCAHYIATARSELILPYSFLIAQFMANRPIKKRFHLYAICVFFLAI